MAQISAVQLQQAETDIAVLQVQFKNLDDKVDEVKSEIRDMRQEMSKNDEETLALIKEFQEINTESHNKMSNKISALEKWRWMLMGAGVVIGALGYPAIAKMLGM